MFTQRCFIRKNSEWLMSELEKLGYLYFRDVNYDKYLATFIDVSDSLEFYDSFNDEKIIDFLCDSIDCGTNEELFLAIAALRDDSDKHQFFTNGSEWIKCEQLDLKHELDNNYEELCVADFHKATVEELIKHFTV